MQQCKIYTKTGDNGQTGLSNGSRLDKDHIRIEAYGTLDELNSLLGLLNTYPLPDTISANFEIIQHHLFELSSELALSAQCVMQEAKITYLEQQIDHLSSTLPSLKNFILPGGTREAALCHMARAVCRRAERCVVNLQHNETVNTLNLKYLNRLSDLLFVTARFLVINTGKSEVLWQVELNANHQLVEND